MIVPNEEADKSEYPNDPSKDDQMRQVSLIVDWKIFHVYGDSNTNHGENENSIQDPDDVHASLLFNRVHGHSIPRTLFSA